MQSEDGTLGRGLQTGRLKKNYVYISKVFKHHKSLSSMNREKLSAHGKFLPKQCSKGADARKRTERNETFSQSTEIKILCKNSIFIFSVSRLIEA